MTGPRVLVINPNTTQSMTTAIGAAAAAATAAGTQVTAVSPPMGPASIESHYDEALAVPGILHVIRAAVEEDTADGFVLACFGDPGLEAARETAQGRPVVGIAQGAMHLASLTGRSFSVVTTLARTEGRAWDLAHAFGFADRCRSVRSCDIPVLDLEDPASDAARVVTALCATALAEDGSDAVVLGCAGMAELCARIRDELGVPVVDGVAAATALVETMVRLGVPGARHGEFCPPRAKHYTGLLAGFAVV
ncbi:aspartate/glutamate racemase family protein [Kocuria turfanensis]|uniref:aspartate/glutamate racemase family protein n=1 Tax=Kocuria turfanensis TaxID=388357 RepID=UPI0040365C56